MAILLPNIIPCVVGYYAILKIGATAVMNNPLYTDRELEHQFNDSGSKLLITLDLLGNRMIDLRGPKPVSNRLFILPSAIISPFPRAFCFPWWAKRRVSKRM